MEFILANEEKVTINQDEVQKLITKILVPNPYWRYSGMLQREEVMTFLLGQSDAGAMKRIAYYILVFCECTAFASYLFSKADGTAQESLEFNLPTLERLRQLYQSVQESGDEKQIESLVILMESAAMKIGADPL